MIDPLSVAGLAITIFDQIIKLGKETAQLISDVRAFDEVRPSPSVSLYTAMPCLMQ